MKCERRSRKNKSKKPWIPRAAVLIPPHKVMRSKKAYNRKKESCCQFGGKNADA